MFAEENRRLLQDDEKDSDETLEELDESEASFSGGPVISTPLGHRSYPRENTATLPVFSTLSIVERHAGALSVLREEEESPEDEMSWKLEPPQTSRMTAATLSLTAIERCIANASVGANSSALAEIILKSKDDLCSRNSGRSEKTPQLMLTPAHHPCLPSVVQLESSGPKESEEDSRTSLKGKSAKAPRLVKLESTKHRLIFGCVDVGQHVVQSTKLKNSCREIMRLKISLRHSLQGFQVIHKISFYTNLVSHLTE